MSRINCIKSLSERDILNEIFLEKELDVNTFNLLSKKSVNSRLYSIDDYKGNKYAVKISKLNTPQRLLYSKNKHRIIKILKEIRNKDIHKITNEYFNLPIFARTVKNIDILIEPFLNEYRTLEDICLNAVKHDLLINIFNKTIKILQELYKIGFNHNDLHMENIMVKFYRSKIHIKIIDYDWCCFHMPNYSNKDIYVKDYDFHVYSEQIEFMREMYFKWFEKKINFNKNIKLLEDNEFIRLQQFVNEEVSKYVNINNDSKNCTLEHYIIHGFFSYKYYIYNQPSTQVDFAKLCIDFSKKFLNNGCVSFETEFMGINKKTMEPFNELVELRNYYSSNEGLIKYLENAKDKNFDIIYL